MKNGSRLGVVLLLVAVQLFGMPGAVAGSSDREGFVYVSSFSIRPPDPARWEPPPGGLMKDGVYTKRSVPDGMRVALTMDVEFSGSLLDPSAWADPKALGSYHERLLVEERRALDESGPNRRVGASSATLDGRFGLPAVARELVIEDVSASTGRVTAILTERTWRFKHPSSSILEFVATVRCRSKPDAPPPALAEEDLSFLSTLEALPLDTTFDRSIPLEASGLDAIASGHGSLWVTGRPANTLTRIDLDSLQSVATIPVGEGPHAIAVTSDAVWVANHNDDTLMRIDPATNRVTATSAVPTGPHQLAALDSGLWLVCDASCLVTRIDPSTAKPTGEPISLGAVKRSRSGRRERLWGTLGRKPDACSDLSLGLAGADRQLYVAERFRGAIIRLDPSGATHRLDVGAEVGPLLFAAGDLWGVDDLTVEGVVYRIRPDTGRLVATIEAGRVSGAPVFGGGLLWLTRERDDTVIRIDPETNRIVGRPIPVDHPAGIVAAESGVWIAARRSVVRVPF